MYRLLLVMALLVWGCTGSPDLPESTGNGTAHDHETAAEYYTCPMHPSVVSDKPGACPVCGMDLVKKSRPKDLSGALAAELNVIKLSPTQQLMANVATQTVKRQSLQKLISAYGRVEHNEKALTTVSAWISGRIDTLFVNFTGAFVRKGQPLYSIYSPELVSTQEEFLLALNTAGRFNDSLLQGQTNLLLESARRRLKLWGLTQKQIDALEKSKRVLTHLRIESPYAGNVIEKMINEGQYVKEGDALYVIADHSIVWVYSEVYEHEIAFVKPGQEVRLTTPAFPGEVFKGSVSYIDPHFDQTTRTIRVRSAFLSSHKLKPGMNATTRIRSVAGKPAIAVPASAVLSTGNDDVVWVEKEPGAFEPRSVVLGPKYEDQYEVMSGLNEGESIVTSAGFLIDSESQLKSSAGSFGGHEHGEKSSVPGDPVTVRIDLPTVQCEMCEAAIHQALTPLEGVRYVHVDVDQKFVSLEYDQSKTSLAKIEGAIAQSGYDANDTPRDPKAYAALPDCCR